MGLAAAMAEVVVAVVAVVVAVAVVVVVVVVILDQDSGVHIYPVAVNGKLHSPYHANRYRLRRLQHATRDLTSHVHHHHFQRCLTVAHEQPDPGHDRR